MSIIIFLLNVIYCAYCRIRIRWPGWTPIATQNNLHVLTFLFFGSWGRSHIEREDQHWISSLDWISWMGRRLQVMLTVFQDLTALCFALLFQRYFTHNINTLSIGKIWCHFKSQSFRHEMRAVMMFIIEFTTDLQVLWLLGVCWKSETTELSNSCLLPPAGTEYIYVYFKNGCSSSE